MQRPTQRTSTHADWEPLASSITSCTNPQYGRAWETQRERGREIANWSFEREERKRASQIMNTASNTTQQSSCGLRAASRSTRRTNSKLRKAWERMRGVTYKRKTAVAGGWTKSGVVVVVVVVNVSGGWWSAGMVDARDAGLESVSSSRGREAEDASAGEQWRGREGGARNK